MCLPGLLSWIIPACKWNNYWSPSQWGRQPPWLLGWHQSPHFAQAQPAGLGSQSELSWSRGWPRPEWRSRNSRWEHGVNWGWTGCGSVLRANCLIVFLTACCEFAEVNGTGLGARMGPPRGRLELGLTTELQDLHSPELWGEAKGLWKPGLNEGTLAGQSPTAESTFREGKTTVFWETFRVSGSRRNRSWGWAEKPSLGHLSVRGLLLSTLSLQTPLRDYLVQTPSTSRWAFLSLPDRSSSLTWIISATGSSLPHKAASSVVGTFFYVESKSVDF